MKMEPAPTFAQILCRYTASRGLSDGRLAKLTDLPRYTIRNWLRGVTKSPRHWQDILHVANALRLDAQEVEALLLPTKHPSLFELWAAANETEKKLFDRWESDFHIRLPAPFQAPPQLPYFVGRADELSLLEAHLNDKSAIFVLQGMGGVGKTTLAAHVAYHMQSTFPDGILWARVDISDPLAILNTFAAAYGEDASPHKELSSRSRFVRNILGQKRTLIILDNVEKSSQIEPLLPPTNRDCRVLVTTRHQNLSIVRGWPKLELKPFVGKEESLTLFCRILGQPRFAETDHHILLKIADLLGHLPLAIAIIAGRLAYESGWAAEMILAQLEERNAQLNMVEDEGQSVRISFDLSYDALSADLKQFFVALGTFNGNWFSPEAAAVVAAIATETAVSFLAALKALSLVQVQNDRYELHPLMQTYAHEKITHDAVWLRYVTYFIEFAESHQADFSALEADADNILWALETAFTHKLEPLLVRGIIAFNRYLEIRGLDDLAVFHLERARQTAVALRQMANLAKITSYLGLIKERQGQLADAEAHYQAALNSAYVTEEAGLIAFVLQHIGRVIKEQKQFERAESFLYDSLLLARENDQPELICNLLNSLGTMVINQHSDYERAASLFQEGLSLAREIAYPRIRCFFLLNLGGIAFRHGRYEQTDGYFDECLAVAEEMGYRLVVGIVQRGQAWLDIACYGDYEQAAYKLQHSIDLVRGVEKRMLGHHLGELGGVLCQLEQDKEARAYLEEALAVADETGDDEIAVCAYKNLGILAGRQHDPDSATACFEKALDMAYRLNDRWHRCQVLLSWGEYALSQGSLRSARSHLTQLEQIAAKFGFARLHGSALYRLACVALAQSEKQKAEQLGQQGLFVLRQIAHFQAVEVAQWLKQS